MCLWRRGNYKFVNSDYMQRELLNSGWRNLRKNAYFSAINLSILAIGITVMVPIANYIFSQNKTANPPYSPGNIFGIESVYTSIRRFEPHSKSENMQEIFKNRNSTKSPCSVSQKKSCTILRLQIINYLIQAGYRQSSKDLNTINFYHSNKSAYYSTTCRTGYNFYERSQKEKKNYNNLLKREL